jgi:hypothetical protein
MNIISEITGLKMDFIPLTPNLEIREIRSKSVIHIRYTLIELFFSFRVP